MANDQQSSRPLPSLQDPEVATLIAALRDIGQAKETRIAHVYKRARQAADLIELLRLREQQAPVSETGEHICPKCGLRVEPHRCGGEDAAF